MAALQCRLFLSLRCNLCHTNVYLAIRWYHSLSFQFGKCVHAFVLPWMLVYSSFTLAKSILSLYYTYIDSQQATRWSQFSFTKYTILQFLNLSFNLSTHVSDNFSTTINIEHYALKYSHYALYRQVIGQLHPECFPKSSHMLKFTYFECS